MAITYERVRELFRYKDGELIRNKTVNRNAKKGTVAGSHHSMGYRHIAIKQEKYLTHRLVWLYHYGYLPEHQVDHINRKRDDNRIENLREVSHSCNLRNCGNRKNNTSGVKGVSFNNAIKMWGASICNVGKNYNLGISKDFSEAVLMRLAAEQCLGWDSCDKMSPACKYAWKNNLFKPKGGTPMVCH